MISFAALSAAFLVGLVGSLHCVGMCGPLAMVVPIKDNRWGAILVYNFARVSVYAALGFIFGALGARVSFLQSGQRFSLILGVLIILFFALPALMGRWEVASRWNSMVTRTYGKLARPLMTYRGWGSSFVLGMVNGVLPCGLVYVALASAVASGSGSSGALLTAAMGLGTFPAMVSMMALRRHFKGWMQKSSRYMLPIVAGVLGLGLVMRGLNLDIPYLSPKVEKVQTAGGEICN